MSADEVTRIAVLLAIGCAWLILNIFAAPTWLKFLSMVGLLGFFASASWLALDYTGVLP